MKNLLSLQNLSFSHGNNKKEDSVLKDISFTLGQGEILGVTGPNGCGKTSLLRIIAGLARGFEGTIALNHQNFKKCFHPPKGFVAYLPQKPEGHDIMPLTCREYVAQGAIYRHYRNMGVEESLAFTGLLDKQKKLVRNFSRGQRQRASLAKMLVQGPLLFLLDEPTTGLDSTGLDRLVSLLKRAKDFQQSVIVVDHNIKLILKHCDRILCFDKSLHWHDKTEIIGEKEDIPLMANLMPALQEDAEPEDESSLCEFQHNLLHEQGDCKHQGTKQHR